MLLVATMDNWLTPLWILGLGAGLGIVLVAMTFGVLAMCGARSREVARDTLTKGIMRPTLIVAGVLTLVCVFTTFVVDAQPLISSLTQLARTGEVSVDVEIPAGADRYEVDVSFRRNELTSIDVASNADLFVEANAEDDSAAVTALRLNANEPLEWQRGGKGYMMFRDDVERLFVTNREKQPAQLRMTIQFGVEHPQVQVVPWIAGLLPLLYLLSFALRIGFPRTSAIALTTSSEAVSQPLFLILVGLGSFALLVFIYIPYNTLGQDVLMLKDMGMTLIKVLAIILAMWTASVAVSDEIEGRTALTVMSKPISRRQFVLGKFLGVIGPIFLVFLILGLVYLATVSYKVVYDAHESSKPDPTWQACNLQMIQTIPGLILSFFEAVTLASISIAISTRLGMLPNLIIISSIYVLGHLMPPLVQSSAGSNPIVAFIGQLIATILPVLDHFDIQAAVAGGKEVPWEYVGFAFLYAAVYCTVAMFVALALFEDRDVA